MRPIQKCRILRYCICRSLNVSKKEFHSRSKFKHHTNARALFFWYGYNRMAITIDVLTDFLDRTEVSFYTRNQFVKDQIDTEPTIWKQWINEVDNQRKHINIVKRTLISII